MPTVANKLANIIVSVEVNNNIDSESYKPDKADINDEIDLDEVQQFIDGLENDDADIYISQNRGPAEVSREHVVGSVYGYSFW